MDNEIVKYDYETKPIRSRAFNELERHHKKINRKLTLLDTIFPGVDVISWQKSAVGIWYWLCATRTENAHKVGLMPNIVVDEHDWPHQRSADGSVSAMQGENLNSYCFAGNPNDLDSIDSLMTVNHSIRVYTKSLKWTVKDIWDGHAPVVVYKTLMAHTLIHEMMHHITTAYNWVKIFESEDEDDAFMTYVKHIMTELGTVDDEMQNEYITLKALRDLVLCDLDGVVDLNAGTRLTPKIGGSYDKWRREKDPVYKERIEAFAVVAAINGSYFFGNELEDYTDEIWEIVDRQKKQAIENHVHVKVVE